jgi:hypothetical protein
MLLGMGLPILIDFILGLAILLIPPVVLGLQWPYMFIAVPDLSPIYAAVGFVPVVTGVAKVVITVQVRAAAKRATGAAPLVPGNLGGPGAEPGGAMSEQKRSGSRRKIGRDHIFLGVRGLDYAGA